jgi:hypothetical protein
VSTPSGVRKHFAERVSETCCGVWLLSGIISSQLDVFWSLVIVGYFQLTTGHVLHFGYYLVIARGVVEESFWELERTLVLSSHSLIGENISLIGENIGLEQ